MANLDNGKIYRKEYLKVIFQLGLRSLSFLRNNLRCTQIEMTVFWPHTSAFHNNAKTINVLNRFWELFCYLRSWFREFISEKYLFYDRCKSHTKWQVQKYINSNNLKV